MRDTLDGLRTLIFTIALVAVAALFAWQANIKREINAKADMHLQTYAANLHRQATALIEADLNDFQRDYHVYSAGVLSAEGMYVANMYPHNAFLTAHPSGPLTPNTLDLLTMLHYPASVTFAEGKLSADQTAAIADAYQKAGDLISAHVGYCKGKKPSCYPVSLAEVDEAVREALVLLDNWFPQFENSN